MSDTAIMLRESDDGQPAHVGLLVDEELQESWLDSDPGMAR